MSESVTYDAAGSTATITLDVPATRNALSADVLHLLGSHLRSAVHDPAVRVVVISHTGPVFCSGMDLRAAAGAPAAEQPVVAFPALLSAITAAPKPVLARVGGTARAGGIGLLAACDIAIGSEDADFAFTETRLGLVPAVISPPVLRRIGAQTARELFLTGETFDAARAAAAGLLDRAVPAENLDAEVDRYVAMLRQGGPRALAATKELLRPDEDTYAELAALSAAHFAGPEGQEGTTARREKRPPSWATT